MARVLFIVGKGRSGSTILDNVLGGVPGIFSPGELLRLWDWGLGRGVRCGCGEDVLDCPLWSKVLDEGFGIRSRDDDAGRIATILRDQADVVRWPRAPRLFARRGIGNWGALGRFAETHATLLRAISDITDARVVVDSSKIPFHPAVLGLVDDLDGSVVHLMRDPRAVGFSWQRTKHAPDHGQDTTLPRYGALHTSASWMARNAGAELTLRRWPAERTMRVRYEDFSGAPRDTVASIVEFMGLPTDDLPFVDETTALLSSNHSVGGNPDRMASGEVAITPDDAWKDELDPRSRVIISTLCAPLRARYGY